MLDMAQKTFVLGKKPIFKLLFNEETMALLTSLKKIVKESGGVKKSRRLGKKHIQDLCQSVHVDLLWTSKRRRVPFC